MSKRRPLTDDQALALAAFVNTHRAITAVKTTRITELEELRKAALMECLRVGVDNVWLRDESGLSIARIGQLVGEVGGRPKLKRRMIPEST